MLQEYFAWATTTTMSGFTDRQTMSQKDSTSRTGHGVDWSVSRDWGSEPIFDALDGTAAGELLSHTPPDPQALPFMDKDAIDRYQAVAEAREATTTPR